MKPYHSLNPTLNALRIANVEDEFITVSPTTGVGDYTSIVEAVNAGHKNIFVKAGTYTETADIVLDGQNLIGESPESTIIELIDHSIEFETHDATNAYDTGTAQLVNNSATVNGGGGTLWDTGANAPSGYADPWLIIRGMAMPIIGFVNDTTLTLKEQYRGVTQTGNYYIIDAKNIGSLFTGFTVKHTPTVGTVCMKISGIGVTVERNVFQATRLTTSIVIQTGVDTNSVAANAVIKNNSILSGTIGIELKNAHSCSVIDNKLQDQNDHGVRTNTDDHDCYGNIIEGNRIQACTNTAVELDTGSAYTAIIGNIMKWGNNTCITADACNGLQIKNNELDGVSTAEVIILTTACSQAEIEGNHSEPHDWTLACIESTIAGNHINGGDIICTGDNNEIVENNLKEGRISATGNYCSVNGNLFEYATADEAIDLDGDNCEACDNVIEDAENNGIMIEGSNCVVNDNCIRSAAGCGIYSVAPGSSGCVITGNCIDIPGGSGIFVYGNGIVITGNRVNSATQYGVFLQGNKGVIDGNTLENCGNDGIRLQQSAAGDGDYTKITGNLIENAGDSGIQADADNGGVSIAGNTIHTSASEGIGINAVGGHFWTVNDNIIIDTGSYGIYFANGGQHSTINDNIIQNANSDGIYIGIGLNDFFGVINGNTVNDAGAHGIFLDREGDAAGDRNSHTIITSNNVQDATSDGILCEVLQCVIGHNKADLCGGHGICVRNGDQTIVDGNSCEANTLNGIDIEATADRIIITSNICLGNGVNQILNNGTNTVTANNIVA